MATPPVQHLDPEVNQLLVQAARAKAKARAKPVDLSRVQKMDPRDPRASIHQWPCMGKHVASPMKGNQHGQWTNCVVCGLRLLYTPRVGSTGQHTQCRNPEMVARCLRELRKLMKDKKPTEAIVLAMQEKIDAEEKLNNMIIEHVGTVVSTSTNAPTTPIATTGYPNPTSGSPDSNDGFQAVDLEEAYAALDNQNQQ